MEDEKSLIKKDLSIILKINGKMNYADITKVQKVHDEIIKKGMFKTNLGTRYIERLKQIIAGTYNDKCIFCGKTIANTEDTVLCDECLKKYETPIEGLELFHGDSISYTGIYNDRTTDGNRIAFKTIAIEVN